MSHEDNEYPSCNMLCPCIRLLKVLGLASMLVQHDIILDLLQCLGARGGRCYYRQHPQSRLGSTPSSSAVPSATRCSVRWLDSLEARPRPPWAMNPPGRQSSHRWCRYLMKLLLPCPWRLLVLLGSGKLFSVESKLDAAALGWSTACTVVPGSYRVRRDEESEAASHVWFFRMDVWISVLLSPPPPRLAPRAPVSPAAINS